MMTVAREWSDHEYTIKFLTSSGTDTMPTKFPLFEIQFTGATMQLSGMESTADFCK